MYTTAEGWVPCRSPFKVARSGKRPRDRVPAAPEPSRTMEIPQVFFWWSALGSWQLAASAAAAAAAAAVSCLHHTVP